MPQQQFSRQQQQQQQTKYAVAILDKTSHISSNK